MCASVLIYTDCVDARVFFVVYIINAHFVYARAIFCYCVWKRGDHNRNTLAQHTHTPHTKTHKMINYLINECGIATGILGNPMYNL